MPPEYWDNIRLVIVGPGLFVSGYVSYRDFQGKAEGFFRGYLPWGMLSQDIF